MIPIQKSKNLEILWAKPKMFGTLNQLYFWRNATVNSDLEYEPNPKIQKSYEESQKRLGLGPSINFIFEETQQTAVI